MSGLQSPSPQSSFPRRDPRTDRVRRRRTTRLRLGALVAVLLVGGLGTTISPAGAAAPPPATPMVDLGHASTYAALSGASVGNTVSADGAPFTVLRGDLGVKASVQPTGFPPGVVTGVTNVGNDAALQAHADVVTAYDEVADRKGGTVLAGALAGTTVGPGLHTIAGAVSNTAGATVTLDGGGDANAVFVFQVNGAMAMAAGSHVVLTGGARASRVFWQVNGAGSVGAGSDFVGTLMATDAVAMGNGTVVNGRALALNGALTLDDNDVYSAPPVVTIAGGASAFTTDTTPTISGTTDVEAPAVVTVTVHGQTLTAVPSDGAWSVSSAILANGTYPVVASVTDGAGNPGSATQQLTVDTVPPAVTLDGGPSATTNDPTPTIAGTSDVAPGTVVRVRVDAQALTALVQAGGTWNVRPAALSDGPRTVTASVTDPAGNESTASQVLTVDTAPPTLTIDGGIVALTNDPTPEISGTAEVPPGTPVTVTLADETLTGLVQADGGWSVTASALSDGPHRVRVTVSDAAGNRSRSVQTLTVDTVSPTVAIAGGTTATTSDRTPTIVGTSDATPGTTVTVSVAGQTMTALVQADGSWNATPSLLGVGTWTVLATVPDPAGNVGSALQTLAVVADAPGVPGGTGPTGNDGQNGGTGQAGGTGGPGGTGQPGSPGQAPPLGASPSGGSAATVAARATVAHSGSQKVTGSSLSIRTKVTAPAGGRVVATASGTVKIKGVKKTIRLTTVVAKIAARRSSTLKQRPKGTARAARAAFKAIGTAAGRRRQVTATITIKIVDAAGHRHQVKRTVKLTR